MLKKIEEVLKQLNIEIAYQVYNGSSDEYIIFDIYDEKDSEFSEDENLGVTYYITINYWHKSKSCISKYKTIKNLFKNNGFFFYSMTTMPIQNSLFGKNFTFKFEEILEDD